MHIEEIVYTKNLDNINKEIKSSLKAMQFVNKFKEKIASNLDSKPEQDFGAFLNNIKNLMSHHWKKMMKTFKIDLIEQNCDSLLVLILYDMHDKPAFEWKILDAIKSLKFESFDQIQKSLKIKRNSALTEEVKEQPAEIGKTAYVEWIKMVLQKVTDKLTKSMPPQSLNALRKDIQNQLSNI